MKKKIEYYIFIFFVKLLRLFGIHRAKSVGNILGAFVFHVIRIRRSVVISNLSKAFPEKNPADIYKLALNNYKNMAATFAELACVDKISRKELHEYLRINESDLKFMKEKFVIGNGLIFLTAHFGNWELGALGVGSHMETSIQVLVKPQSNKYISKWIDDVRMQFGNKVIPLGASIRNIYKALKEGNAVGIVGDQRGSREGMRVKFFNQSTAVYPGAAQIAIKNRVPIVTVIAARVSDNKFNTFIGEIRTDDLTGSIEDQVKEVNQRYMSVLEDIIRKYPDQWFWMHNIWKY